MTRKTVRTAGGMIQVPGRHLGRARRMRRKRRLQPSEMLAEPQHWMPCNLCGGLFVFTGKGPRDHLLVYMGKRMCWWCKSRDGKKQIQYMVLVEKMAEQIACLKDNEENCKCLTCTARRVVARDSTT